jgi:hypothetical protein
MYDMTMSSSTACGGCSGSVAAPQACVLTFLLAFDRAGAAPVSYTPGVLAGPGDR